MIGLTNSKNYKDIADAIRAKGVSGDFKPSEMAAAIRSISGGGGENYLKYTSEMGWAGSGTVIDNKPANLLALATAASKDLQIALKVGTATFDNVIMHFYADGEYLRLSYNSSNNKITFQVGPSPSTRVVIDPSKDVSIIIHTSTKKFEFIQDGTTLELFDYWSSSMKPFDTVSGSTSIYAGQNWLEYLTIAFI